MKEIIYALFALSFISIHQANAFQPVRLPSRPSTQAHKLHSSGSTSSNTFETATFSRDALGLEVQHEKMYVEQGVKQPSLNAQKVLGLAFVIFGGAAAGPLFARTTTHYIDSAAFESTVHTLQHVLQTWGSHAWKSYHAALASNPITTKGLTSATVYSIGDVIAQKSDGSNDNDLDLVRIARSGLAGGIGHGPLSHFWYNLSEEFFNNVVHLTAWWSFLPKIAIDQIVWGPFWNASYILLLGLMKQEATEKMIDDARSSTIPLLLDGLKLWPLAHCVTYNLPVENRLLWVDLVEILWVSILAAKASSLKDADNQERSIKS